MNENDLSSENQSQSRVSLLPPSLTLDKTNMRRATRSQSRVTSFTKSPSPSSSKPSLTPVLLDVDNSQSPASQGAEPIRDVDMDRGSDELDLIGSPLSEDNVSLVSFTDIDH